MIVDAHMHLWEQIDGRIGKDVRVLPLRNGMVRMGGDKLLGMPAYMLDCAARAELAVAEFDAAGVDKGVVVQEYMDGAQNNYLVGVVERFGDRFFVHALPDFWDADHAAEEVRGFLRRGFRGVKLPAEHLLNTVRLDDKRLMPIWEVMEANRSVLAVDLSEGTDQVAEMEQILARFPQLHVALGHFGMVNRGGWPGQLELCRHKNVYMDTGGIVWLYRHEGYPFPGAMEAIQRAMALVGVDKLMWGSDWPRTMIDFTYRQSIDFIRRSSDLSDEQKTLLLGGNAARLYRLPEPSIERQPAPLVTEQ